MSERKNLPQTSKDAYKAVSIEMLNTHHSKILKALKVLGSATAEKIGDYIGMSHHQVNRRVSEMERLELIWRPGGKALTKTNRSAFLWTLRGDQQPKTEKELRYSKNEKTAADLASGIIKNTNPTYIQQNLL